MKQERLSQIENYVKIHKSCTVEDLSLQFNVSQITIRRDIAALVDKGSLYKIYGGVSALTSIGPLLVLNNVEIKGQQIIPKIAAALVNDGDTIFLDEGEAIPLMVPFLDLKNNITIITNNIFVLNATLQNYDLNVICFGGKLQQATNSFVGNSGQNFHCRKAFISAESVSIEYGIGNSNFYSGITKRLAIENSDIAYLVVDSASFSEQSYNIFAKLNVFSGIVSDKALPENIVKYCMEKKINLYCGT